MQPPSWIKGAPRKVLVATDLTTRSDRALDRAMSLCAHWGAQLVALHVLERPPQDSYAAPLAATPPSGQALRETAARQLGEDLGIDGAKILVAQGDADEEILRAADAEGCDLIVVGIGRNGPPGQSALGGTVSQLIRRARPPVLIVRKRARRAYLNITVATDFSAPSRHGLEAAAHLFSQHALTAFHAYEAPMAGLTITTTSAQDAYRAVTEQEWGRFLIGVTAPHADWRPPELRLTSGVPARELSDYAHSHKVDLVVVGSHGRSSVLEALLGSVAKEIVDWSPCDVLVVRDPRRSAGPPSGA